MWEVVADPDPDGLFLPVVSDMQYSGLSSTPIVVILKHKDLGNFSLSASAVDHNNDYQMMT